MFSSRYLKSDIFWAQKKKSAYGQTFTETDIAMTKYYIPYASCSLQILYK